MRQSLGSGKNDDVKVLMLEGGIHNYLEWIKQERTSKENPQQESLWLGKNYIFDARQSLGLDERNDTADSIETNDATSSAQLISSCEGCAVPCARYVKCDGFGCHRLIISCTKCSPVYLVATGKSGMCCCRECVEMGEKVQEYVVACESGPVEGPRVRRGICQCERSRRIALGEE
jgi:predicted sulfurtransferase